MQWEIMFPFIITTYIWLGYKHYFYVLLGPEMINFHWGALITPLKTVINIAEQQ